MKISNKSNFLIFQFLINISLCNFAAPEKFEPKNLEYFGIRYLDHLEYEVPEHTLPDIPKRKLKQNFNPEAYIDLINKHYQAPVYIAFIGDGVGYGIFAAEDIKRGQMIGEYTGIVKPVNFSKKAEDFDYAWGFPPPTKFVIDSKDAGNFTRFINHSIQPNIDMLYVPINNRWHLVYVANQDIKKDQQILANYGKDYWRGRGVRPFDLK